MFASGALTVGDAVRDARGMGDIVARVEYFFIALLIIMTVAVAWFACYVVYRLFSDRR
ncbi:MAG: hypothetical protein ACRDRN_08305 [Sciscionella sp.]